MNEKSSIGDHLLVADPAAFPGNGTQFPGTPGNRGAAKTARGEAMGRANRTTARSALAAVVVMVMALAAFLGTTEPGLAATVSGAGEHAIVYSSGGSAVLPSAVSGAADASETSVPCFNGPRDQFPWPKTVGPECESTDPRVTVADYGTNDLDCWVQTTVFWTDPGKAHVGPVYPNGARGVLVYETSHVYSLPGVYYLAVVTEGVAGNCIGLKSVWDWTFTLR
jgi:hypothetical protein